MAMRKSGKWLTPTVQRTMDQCVSDLPWMLIPANISPIAALVADFLRAYLKEKLQPL